MEKKFKPGDKVYHKNLKKYGIFIEYAWESDEECDVDFEMEDGEREQRHVSVNWLELANRTVENDGFEFDGVIYKVGEKIKVTERALGNPKTPRKEYVGRLVAIYSYKSTITNKKEIDFIFDTDQKHPISLRFVEKIERFYDEI